MIRDLVRMMVAAVLVVAVVPIAGCNGMPGAAGAQAGTAAPIGGIRQAFDSARAIASLFTPFLPAAQRRHVELLADRVHAALAIAELAVGATERERAAAAAERALADYRLAAGA